jgi:hypothetical protein
MTFNVLKKRSIYKRFKYGIIARLKSRNNSFGTPRRMTNKKVLRRAIRINPYYKYKKR